MAENGIVTYWVADNLVADQAFVHRWQHRENHSGRLARVSWAAQVAASRGEDPGAAVRNPEVQLYGVRLRRLVQDEATLPEQGFVQTDVLVLLPNDSEQVMEALEAFLHRFPEQISRGVSGDRLLLSQARAETDRLQGL